MRLGEVMITGGLITSSELEAARARQRETGARLGTTLLELGMVGTDDVARALARQHGVPAALSRHLRDRDRAVVAYLPADLARELHALPVALSRGAAGANLVVCFRDPDPDIIAEVARIAGIPVIPSVACERVLERELGLAYPAPPTPAPRPAPVSPELLVEREDTGSFDINVDDGGDDEAQGFGGLERLALVDLDDRRVSRDHSQNVLLPAMRDGGQSQNLRAIDPGRSTTIPPSSPSGVFAAVTADGVSRVPSPPASNPALRPTATTPPATNPALRPTATTTPPATNPALRPTATTTPPATNPALRPTATTTPPATNPALRPTAATTPPATNPALRPTAATTPAGTNPALRPVATPSVPRTITPVATPSVPRTITSPVAATQAAPSQYFHPSAAGPTATVEGAALCIGPRDLVAERFLPHLIASWRIAVVLAVERGAVTPCTGVGGTLTPTILQGTETSLTGSSILRSVVEARRPHVGDSVGPGGVAREPWLYGLISAGRELVVAPVIVDDQVVRIIVAVGARLELGAAAGEVLRVARTMVDAYTRGSQPRSG